MEMKNENLNLNIIKKQAQQINTRLDVLSTVLGTKPQTFYYYILQNGAEVRRSEPMTFPLTITIVESGKILFSEYVIKRDKNA